MACKKQFGKSYIVDYMTVKSFNNMKYLNPPIVSFKVTTC